MVNSNEFFKNFTLNICSSLDLNVAMKRSLDYLRQVFPVEEILMNIFDPKLGAVRVVARATVDDSKPAQEVLPLPDDFCEWIKKQAPSGPIIMTD
ncbi:hypothetical protein LJB86_03410, partial [Deltaproteobacteria bacterium OttesenSCG-928-M10]|nr:hypothetical protein [Deltaproteobacteria bacterium OttesenSCG-928-M10]